MRAFVGLLLVSAVAFVGCQWLGLGGLPANAPPTLRLRVKSNGQCHVCHMNYEEEKLAVTHVEEGVGCATCHGPSDAHCNDENNLTPPDVLYPRGQIDAACMKCHSRDKLAKRKEHAAALAGAAADRKVCTDCHGEHRLARRTVRWDKVTRKVLPPKD